jgi:hypothetical protein
LYKECALIPYDLYINKNIINKNDNNILDKNDKNNFKLFKTENYELKYAFNENEDIYSKEYIYDNDIINNLINLLEYSNPFCSLEYLLIIYNIKYLLYQVSDNQKENKDNIKYIEFTKEQKSKLLNIFYIYIQKINSLLVNNLSIKLSAFESFENLWNIYNNEYKINSKNLIIKYILTTNYISIPNLISGIEDYPFKVNNNKYIFNICLMAYLSLNDLINNYNNKKEFPIENGNLEYKIGDKINIEKVNIHNSNFKIIKILLKKNYNNDLEEYILFMNKNSVILGIEEKNCDVNELRVKYIYPLRELEICIDNTFSYSLQLYFRKSNHIIECGSNEERKEIKSELEKKRNEFRKWEQDKILSFFSEQEKKSRFC